MKLCLCRQQAIFRTVLPKKMSLFPRSLRYFIEKSKEDSLPVLNQYQQEGPKSSTAAAVVNPLQQAIIDEANKYKIYEDSVGPTIKELNISEIKGHSEFLQKIKEVIHKDEQDELFVKTGLVVLTKKNDLFFKSKLDSHNYLIKYRDKDYKIDINEVLTRDLFKKQRVVDSFAEVNKGEIVKLLSASENRFNNYIKENKFVYHVYRNPYSMKVISKHRSALIFNLALNLIITPILIVFNPAFLFVQLFFYYRLAQKMNFFRKLVHEIHLCTNKQQAIFRTFNFLGFQRDLASFNPIDISSIMTFQEKYFRKSWRDRIWASSDKTVGSTLKNRFKSFYAVYGSKKLFYIPEDAESQSDLTNEELTLHILNGSLEKVAKFDYSAYEIESTALYNRKIKHLKEYYEKNHLGTYESKEEKLERLYSKYLPNLDFESYDQTKLLRDKSNGYFIDNG